ncbi:hypothetical protein ACHAXT_005088 [Thalassiosira profunda]
MMMAALATVLLLELVLGVAAAAAGDRASCITRRPPAFVASTLVHRTPSSTRRWLLPRLHSSISEYQPLDQLADDDLVALPFDCYIASMSASTSLGEKGDDDGAPPQLRLCVVRNRGATVLPLIRHEDDVPSDLFLDPRHNESPIRLADVVAYWLNKLQTTDSTTGEGWFPEGVPYYGVGWYGQRPVPSLGGGPGYGAEADEVWSIDETVLESMLEGGDVAIPIIDVGMAHGEKARGGALF